MFEFCFAWPLFTIIWFSYQIANINGFDLVTIANKFRHLTSPSTYRLRFVSSEINLFLRPLHWELIQFEVEFDFLTSLDSFFYYERTLKDNETLFNIIKSFVWTSKVQCLWYLFEHLMLRYKTVYCNWPECFRIRFCSKWKKNYSNFIEITIYSLHSVSNWMFHFDLIWNLYVYLILIELILCFCLPDITTDDNTTFYTNTSTDCTNIGFIKRIIKISSRQHGHRNAGKSNI